MKREIEHLKQEREKIEEFCEKKEENINCKLLKTQGAMLTNYVKKQKDEMQNIK